MVTKKAKHSPRIEQAQQLLREFRELYEREGWTHQELAQKSRIPINTVGRWLRGNSIPNSPMMLEGLEKFLSKHRPK